MFARWILPKAGKKAVQTIKSVRPGSDTGAKSKQYFQNKASAARINLDKAKLVQNREITDDKLEQNEDLAQLRADTAIAKSIMSAETKLTSDRMKAKDVKTLKGPKR